MNRPTKRPVSLGDLSGGGPPLIGWAGYCRWQKAAGQTTGTVMQTAVIVTEAPLLGRRAIMTSARRLRALVRPERAMSGEP